MEQDNKRLDQFKKTIPSMVETSNRSYNGDYGFARADSYVPYSKEEALSIIESGDSTALRELSYSYFYCSGFYRKFMLYYATLLKYATVLIPLMRNGKTLKDSKYSKKYNNCVNFFESLNFKLMCINFALGVFVEGAYYGEVIDSNDSFTIRKLPFDYCRSRFKNTDNIDIVEFNLQYFDTILKQEERIKCLNTYSKEVRKAYNNFKNKNATKWYMFPAGKGIYFKLYEERPFMLNVIPAIIDFEEYKVIEKEKSLQELKKLLIQKMPITNDGELVFEPEEVKIIHDGVVGMLKGNKDVNVLTSFGNVTLEDLQDTKNVVVNNLEKIEKVIYSEAGVSKQLFAAEGNLSLTHSIENDLSLTIFLAESFVHWMTYLLNEKFADKNFSIRLKLLPVSYYNEEAYIKNSLNMAQYGYSFLIPAIASGLSQSEFIALKDTENEFLSLHQKLIPLQSSYTQTANSSAQNEGLEETQQTEKTIQNKEYLK